MQSQTKLVKTVYAVDDAGKQYVIRMFIDERDILHKKTRSLPWYEDRDGLVVEQTDDQAGIFKIIGIGTVRRIGRPSP
jgi:hypothetical protein